MNNPVAALAWEIWRKNRYGFWLLFALLLVCIGLSRVAVHFGVEASHLAATLAADAPELLEANARAENWMGFVVGWSTLLLGGSLLVAFAVFALSESHVTRGFSGIPARLFTLPVRTADLVGVPVVSGVGFVAALYLTWSRLVLAPILPGNIPMPDAYLLLLLAAALVAFQALVWTLVEFPKTRATLLTLLVSGLVFLATLPFIDLARWPERRLALMTVFAVSLAVVPLIAWVGVKQLRKGEWREWPALTGLMTCIANKFVRRRNFVSPAAALFWIECRRAGRPALGGLAVFILFVLGFSTYAVLKDGPAAGAFPDLVGLTISPILMATVCIWTPILGLMVCGDGASRRLRMTTFQATRPVSAGHFITAKLKTMVTLWVGGGLLVVTCLAVWAVACGLTDHLLDRFTNVWDFRVLAVMVVVSLHILVGLFPLWLSGRVPESPWPYLGLLVVYGGVANVIMWFDQHPQFQDAALLLIGFAAAVKLGAAAIAFRQAWRRRLVTRGFIFTTVSFWVVGTALCVQLMSVVVEQANWNEALMLPFAALLFPIARIALAPLALEMNRHR